MIQQVNNSSVREVIEHQADVDYLKTYYQKYGKFPMFKQVLVETRTDCNNHCPFCPHAFNNKPLGIMDWECYTTIIDQLCEIQYNGRVALMLSNEPLLETRLERMIEYAKDKSQRFFFFITTNDRFITLPMVDKLFKLGLDNININDYRGDRDICPEKGSSYLKPVFKAYGNNPTVHFKHT